MSLLTVVFVNQATFAVEPKPKIDFNSQIRPIISKNCIACHGPDEGSREADFRIDIRDDALAGIEPGDPDSSDVFDRITSDDEDYRMPPLDHGNALTAKETKLIKQWIEQGAKYDTHWAFVKPKQAPVPTILSDRIRGPIDPFVLEKLQAHPSKLDFLVDASPAQLIRRVALDLTGLPPSQKMVDRYKQLPNDETYEAIVDELLAQPAYGEHWAGMWLDLARYADTRGYANDRGRIIWPWRDWVITAFNSNMPYDQFTTEQLAGDQLPDPTDDQILATAFNRNTLNNDEGGSIDEEFRTIAVKDRINTTVNVWMGLTFRCAECHTHKYDPITQKEYYQFYDFFNQTEDNDRNNEHPVGKFPNRSDLVPENRRKEIATLKARIKKAGPVWNVLTPESAISTGGATMETLSDHSVLASGKNVDFDTYTFTFELPAGTFSGLRFEALPDKANGNNVGRNPDGSFIVNQLQAFLIDQEKADKETELLFSGAYADHRQSKKHYFVNVIAKKHDDLGWAVKHPKEGYKARRFGVLTLKKELKLKQPRKLKFVVRHQSKQAKSNVGRMRLSWTAISKPAEKLKTNKLDPDRVRMENLQNNQPGTFAVPIMRERPSQKARTSHLMLRGSYLSPGKKVTRAVPESFNAFPKDAPNNRLGVAQWLVSDDNPLTARVTVNRFWGQLFGKGIVETEEDFGTQGFQPTHPELLDWLAVDFQKNGWDVKRLLKQIVLSTAYRQTSQASGERFELDPRNDLLSRGTRFRIRAETVRDQALAVSGLLSRKLYGQPVYPPNPIKEVRSAFAGRVVWKTSTGEDRYRRAIYTYLKRSSPHPLFDTFDMASREVCNLRRIRTNTPIQVFMSLNDPVFVEAAQALAKQMHDQGKTPAEQISFGFQQALFEPPSERQLKPLTELYQKTLEKYNQQPELALKLIGKVKAKKTTPLTTSQLAALTVVANVILNQDAFLTR